MIVVLILGYVAVLFLAIKIGIIKPTGFWKVSPVIWAVAVFVGLVLPMNWGAPSGPCQIMQVSVPIAPNVNGVVSAVHVEPWQTVEAGQLLFELDPTQFQAAVDSLEAQLELAETRLEQSSRLLARQAGSAYEVQQFQSQVNALRGQLASAQWNLDSTTVEASNDGVVVGVSLAPGQRVSAGGAQAYVTLVVETKRMLVSVHQRYLRYTKPGQPVEVALKILPGRIITGRVLGSARMTQSGVLAAGAIVAAPDGTVQAFPVMIELDPVDFLDREGLEQFGGGLAGTAAIYTDSMQMTHAIRKIMMRMNAWKNYVF